MPRTTSGPPSRLPDAALLQSVLDALPSPTLLIDAAGTVLFANTAWDAAARLLDDARLAVGDGTDYFAMARSLRDDATVTDLVEGLRAVSRGEQESVALDYAFRHPGGVRWYHLVGTRVGDSDRVVVTHSDVTSRVRAERSSSWQARHDPLTGLPNRAHLLELIDRELARPGRGPVSVLFLDVDGFKEVNDSLGHEAGDAVLREVAARLTGCVRGSDTVGRLGGDEFVVLSPGCGADVAGTLADRCREVLARPVALAGRDLRLGASVGLTTAPPGSCAARSTDLVRDADLAMYAAKADGRNRTRRFSPDLRTAAERRAALADELRTALETDQLVLHYQPIVHLPTRALTGAEALVRWQHPERGLLAPGEFLPTAETHDLLTPLARWVLRAATRQAAAWRRDGLDLIVGVNIHASHFSTGTLVDDVLDAVDAAGLPPSRLVVELTETAVADDADRAAAQFAELRRCGVEVSIDDFGSGFSSLGQLVSIPTGILKIDRSLVAYPEGRRAQAAAAIAAVVALGRACGIRSLAEGVETAEQLELAAELGCTYAQGFHIARPMPAAELARFAAGQCLAV
ncbi:putative bifunctional diguanylate cyclase/phosphodiesterase [Blastococcus sp. SYSU D00820]